MSVLTELPRELYPADAFAKFSGESQFRLGTARAMMWLSQLAYEVPTSKKVDDIIEDWGLARVAVANPAVASLAAIIDLNAMVLVKDATIFVVFQGTDPLRLAQWITDFDFPLTATGVHHGFDTAVCAMRAALDVAIQQALSAKAGRRLVFSGHSLGAALAAIAAAKAVAAGWPVNAVYTFGMPRTGNAAFAQAYNRALGDRTYRLVYGVDIVPTVPPSAAPFDYRHVGRYLPSTSGRFDGKFLTESPDGLAPQQWSEEPTFRRNLRDQIEVFRSHGPRSILPLFKRLALAGRLSLGVKPGRERSDPVGFLIEHLPPPLRDHIPDRYCQALPAVA